MPQDKPAKVVPPWKVPREARPMPMRDKMLADEVISHPERSFKDIARKQGMTIYQAETTLAEPHVRDYIALKMEEAGATVERATRVYKEAMDAEKVNVTGSLKHGFQEHREPDHMTRMKAAEMVLRVNGFINNPKTAGEGEGSLSALVIAIRRARSERGLAD